MSTIRIIAVSFLLLAYKGGSSGLHISLDSSKAVGTDVAGALMNDDVHHSSAQQPEAKANRQIDAGDTHTAGSNKSIVALFCTETSTSETNNRTHLETISGFNFTLQNILCMNNTNDTYEYLISAKYDQSLLPVTMRSKICDYFSKWDVERAISELCHYVTNMTEKSLSEKEPGFDYEAFRQQLSDEQRLFYALMTNYEKSVRPVLKSSQPVNLKIGLTLNQIDVDEKNQVLTVLVWLDQEWTDEKLLWNPDDYTGLEVLRVPCNKLWLPDIVLYNSVEDLREGYMQAIAMVSHTGNVFWPPIVKYRGNCEIEIKYFPFDDQICHLKLGTWAYDGSQVNVTKRRDGIDLSNYQSNGEWQLLRTITNRNVVYYSCCPEPYMDVTFTIYLRRRTLYYFYNLIIPCVMLSVLTLLSFWMKPDSGEKINLGLTILLAFSVFMLLIAERMPSTSFHVPIIGIYITSTMCLTAFSVVSAVFVANINRQADGDQAVPYWIHKMSHGLGRLMCVKMVSWEERHCNVRQLAMKVALSSVKTNNKPQANGGSGKKSGSTEVPDEDPLLKRLHTIVEHQEELLQKQNTSEDWHAVAVIIDRCLFWTYLIMMLSVTIGCLLIFPQAKPPVDNHGEFEGPL